MIPARLRPFLLLSTLALASCAQYATVSQVRPRFRTTRAVSAPIAQVEQSFAQTYGSERSAPLQALGEYLSAADTAAQTLAANPRDDTARDAYNFAVSRVFTTFEKSKTRLDPWTQPLRVPSAKGDYLLTTPRPRREIYNPALYELTPADEFAVKGTYVKERTIKPGVGASLVAIGKQERKDAKTEYVAARTYYGVTAVARFDRAPDSSGARRVVLTFEDPLATETIELNGQRFPLAADFTVPLAVMLARENPKKLELARVLWPGSYAETAHIVRLQPYDPNKTVVIVIHGLMDSQATWTPMLNTLLDDPVIRQNFQFWFYSYPSGYPYPHSAAIMRRELDGIEKRFPLHKPVVLIGHSMGSLISRLMITDSGDRLWAGIFRKPPATISSSPKTRQMLSEALIFNHRPEVGRVIFISGPHRGSEMASNFLGRFASRLVKAPLTLLKVANEVRSAVLSDSTTLRLNSVPNSVDTLAPNNRFVKIINTVPITPGIPYHSIMGDRGKGGNHDHTPPVSTDGVVPYWSSHLDGTQSELVVPSNHSAHQNAQAIQEVRRILTLHAQGISRTIGKQNPGAQEVSQRAKKTSRLHH